LRSATTLRACLATGEGTESRVIEKMGESGIEAAIERERSWMRMARMQW
jgi:hypothetical protein